MKKILFIIQYYLPGFRIGGPLQTVKNIVDIYGNQNDIYILSLNHDMGYSDAYPVSTNVWTSVGLANVMYVKDEEYTLKQISTCAEGMDIIYCCSLFAMATLKTLLAKKIKDIDGKVVVAPMGVFSEGAMKQKLIKKKMFLSICRYSRLFENITWSFSSENEKNDAIKYIKKISSYIIAEDLPRKVSLKNNVKKKKKVNCILFFYLEYATKKIYYTA